MARRRKYTLIPSILRLFEALEVKAWITPQGRIAHDGDEALREEIGQGIETARTIGVRGTALLFVSVLLVAMDRGCWTEGDVGKFDALGQGNMGYALEKLREVNGDA
ncbi:hypothetical protein [Streptomyces regalis]|uniref:Uncharacterized protein n=1 Tax=Streptomyces regalis TaxID=68262 RepID=A0A124G728_9ACTN|nr:hypothetical protein [Streptomyces regalis]KUL21445.1 hypothetical protein ADL12_44680 [Streptomyces regalis]